MAKNKPAFGLREHEKTAVFIDGANLYATTKALGFDIDYKKFLAYFNDESDLVRASYYTAMIDDQEYSSIKPLVDWLVYNGYNLVTKPVREFTDPQGRRRFKGNMDVEIVCDMIELAPNVDHIILFSGDGDFCRALDIVQRMGKRVTVVSTIKTQPAMTSDDLRRKADIFTDLDDVRNLFERPGAERATRFRHDEPEDQALEAAPVREAVVRRTGTVRGPAARANA